MDWSKGACIVMKTAGRFSRWRIVGLDWDQTVRRGGCGVPLSRDVQVPVFDQHAMAGVCLSGPAETLKEGPVAAPSSKIDG